MKEFELIERYFAPLSAPLPQSRNLRDDAAILDTIPGRQLIISTDACVEGIHFFPEDSAAVVAIKALGAALSDLAAMGARPLGYTLTLALPGEKTADWLETFSTTLKEHQENYEIPLLGGDTVKMNGPLTVSITVLGSVPEGQALLRSGAQLGDRIYLSGTLGDVFLGQALLQGDPFPELDEASRERLKNRARLPVARIKMGQSLCQFAHAAIDLSDGFIADLQHICEESDLCAHVKVTDLPFSEDFRRVLETRSEKDQRSLITHALTNGDEYELVFTVAPGDGEHVAFLADLHDLPITLVGHLGVQEKNQKPVRLLHENGTEWAFKAGGYEHQEFAQGQAK